MAPRHRRSHLVSGEIARPKKRPTSQAALRMKKINIADLERAGIVA
jgi:hypothetical protein